MNIVQITPGAGGMFCGNCLRDNALVAELRALGHSTLMVPLYLPMTLEEEDQSAGTPIFFGGINVYLDSKSILFRKAPRWLHRSLTAPWLLRWAADRATNTRPEEVGRLTLSMLRGELGDQARELEELIDWLRGQSPPEVICLSNALLIGMAKRLKAALRAPVVCMLQGEAPFLDALPEPLRGATWRTMADRTQDADLFISPSHSFARLMAERLGIALDKIRVVYNGINAQDFSPAPHPPDPPVLGYFARICREKGIDRLVQTFLLLKKRNRIPGLKLKAGGGLGATDKPLLHALQNDLQKAGFQRDAEFHPNLTRAQKVEFYRSFSVFSVPALYGEAFGLYLLEALASGVPVVQPRHGAFPELIEATGGGIIVEPDAPSLALAIENLLLQPEKMRALGKAGRQAVEERFSTRHMAMEMINAFQSVTDRRPETKD